MRSSDEARQLYNENKMLIHKTIHMKFNNPEFLELHGITKEELVQSGRIGLYKACQDYDESKGTKFSTHAINNIKWAISVETKRDSLGSIGKWTFDLVDRVSFDKNIEGNDDVAMNLYDLVGLDDIGYFEVEEQEKVEHLLTLIENNVSERAGQIARLKMQGLSNMEIGEMLGVTHQNISSILRTHKKKIVALIGA